MVEPRALGTAFTGVAAVRDEHHRGRANAVAVQLSEGASLPLTDLPVAGADRDGGDVGAALADRVAGCTGTLVVLEAFGGGPPDGGLYDPVAEHVLRRGQQPVLVLGPEATPIDAASALLVPIDGTAAVDVLDAEVRRWAATFRPHEVTLVGLGAPDPWPADASAAVHDPARRLTASLRAGGVSAALRRVTTTDTDLTAVVQQSVPDRDAVLVVAAPRWPSAENHWYATARRLIRRGPWPVLVVPAA